MQNKRKREELKTFKRNMKITLYFIFATLIAKLAEQSIFFF